MKVSSCTLKTLSELDNDLVITFRVYISITRYVVVVFFRVDS